jgi:putative DNA primase/helicase
MSAPTPVVDLPKIDQYEHDLPGVVAQAEDALSQSAYSPRIFQRGNALVFIVPAEPRPKDRIRHVAGTPLIRTCLAPALRLSLARAAQWYVPNKRNQSLEQQMPKPWVVETVLGKGEWATIPPLTGVILAPTIRSDGSILDTPGYDAATGLFYEPGAITFPPIPPQPTKADALVALEVLAKPFQDFPFKEPHHYSAALAGVLTVLIRHAIPGFVPMFGIKAPTAGTGKTLLADTIALIATGRASPKLSQPPTEEEWNKQLFTCALEGDQLVLIDNCTQIIASSELCKNITAEAVKSRILGLSKNGEAPQDAVYFATGNNLRFRSDIVRRVIPIDLQSPLERPETRTEFVLQSPLLPWTLAQRPALVCAALTILRAYALAHEKPRIPTIGSFEAWGATICAPLVWLGLANPMDGTDEIKDEDEDRERLRELLLAWYAIYGDRPTTLKTVKQDINLYTQESTSPQSKYHELFEALKAYDHSKSPLLNLDSVGKGLKRDEGRPVCGKVLTQAKTRASSGYPWIVTMKNECRCVGCVGVSTPARENIVRNDISVNGNTVVCTGNMGQTPTQPTLGGYQTVDNRNGSSGLFDSVGHQTTYTDASQREPGDDEEVF